VNVSWSYSAKSKVKKVIYKLDINDKPITITFKDGHWDDYDRKWKCELFDLEYDAKIGRDVIYVETKEGADPSVACVTGFVLGKFFHPSQFADHFQDKAVQYARSHLIF